jgi:hypothetical protein
MDVVTVVSPGKPARIAGTIGIPAVDELGRAQRPTDGGELAHEVRAGAPAHAATGFAVDGADVHRAAGARRDVLLG